MRQCGDGDSAAASGPLEDSGNRVMSTQGSQLRIPGCQAPDSGALCVSQPSPQSPRSSPRKTRGSPGKPGPSVRAPVPSPCISQVGISCDSPFAHPPWTMLFANPLGVRSPLHSHTRSLCGGSQDSGQHRLRAGSFPSGSPNPLSQCHAALGLRATGLRASPARGPSGTRDRMAGRKDRSVWMPP